MTATQAAKRGATAGSGKVPSPAKRPRVEVYYDAVSS